MYAVVHIYLERKKSKIHRKLATTNNRHTDSTTDLLLQRQSYRQLLAEPVLLTTTVSRINDSFEQAVVISLLTLYTFVLRHN